MSVAWPESGVPCCLVHSLRGHLHMCLCACLCVHVCDRYDNEYGYSARMVDLAAIVAKSQA